MPFHNIRALKSVDQERRLKDFKARKLWKGSSGDVGADFKKVNFADIWHLVEFQELNQPTLPDRIFWRLVLVIVIVAKVPHF